MDEVVQKFKDDLSNELHRLMEYWETHTQDISYGGFHGRLDHYGVIVPKAPKGIILNTRILWSFSATCNHLKSEKYLDCSKRSFEYIKDFFYDNVHKGVYWEVDYTGKPVNKRKQIYAQAFAIYSFSEYYVLVKDEAARNLAVDIYHQIENYAFDELRGGYLEAFGEEWNVLDDVRLSEKDMNALKTMNTHLHIIEAYTALLKIHRTPELEKKLKTLIETFLKHFLNQNNHFNLFFDENWKLLSNTISYGHDIESAWLITEGAKEVGDQGLIEECQTMAIKVADVFISEAIDSDGGVMNEMNLESNIIDTDRHWWPQMEAILGLIYVYNLNGNKTYLDHAIKIWDFTKKHLIDTKNGEWHFRIDKNGQPYTQEDKVSMWKAPYHTSRACMMINNLL